MKKELLYKTMKVFDCQDMPEEVQRAFFEYAAEIETMNDTYVYWLFREHPKGNQIIVQNWLSDHGADGENVLINHWW